jgi:hypothetical protein
MRCVLPAIQSSRRRMPGSSCDHVLDLVVEPDRTVARKDEDECVLAVAQRGLRRAETGLDRGARSCRGGTRRRLGPPFCDGWETFRPDPAWPIPHLTE